MKSSFKLSLSQIYFLGVWGTLMAIAGVQSWSRIVEAKVSPSYTHKNGEQTIERRAANVVTNIHSSDASHTNSPVRRLDQHARNIQEKSST